MDESSHFEHLILEGAVEVSGIDSKTGEFLYNFTDKFKDLYPELYKEAQTFFSKEMMFLWENHFVSMDITEENPMVNLTEKALDDAEVSKLDPDTQTTLREVIRLLSMKNDTI